MTTSTYRFGLSLVRQDESYPMFDARGNLRLVLDEDEEVVAECAPEGTGSDLPVIGAPTMANRFGGAHGYRDDGDIGLIHVGARYYDPINCRFITRDSHLDQHPYVYCDGDPINFADPSGHDFLDDASNFFAGVGDTLTLGGTGLIRNAIGVDDVVDQESGMYIGGRVAGAALGAAIGAGVQASTGLGVGLWRYARSGGGGLVLARQGKRVFSLDLNRWDAPWWKWMHYHKGTGNQGGKHRPWQGW